MKSMGDHWDFESVVVSQKSRAYKTLLKQNYIWPIAKKKIEIDPIINNLDWEAACPKCETSRWSYKHIDIIFPNNNIDEVDCFRIDCGLPYRYHSYVTEKYWHEIAKFNLTNIDAMVAGEAIF
ncbi:hypothetical protein [Asticcacaulis biprosthecium]|uniref:hypothetical protein n=1 Tax=Asticcacaulis biprosthecium TaxID=76891 RepID=UPI0012F4A28C|nr:hypothetical protein [Asticcacaulis biprosthecium]